MMKRHSSSAAEDVEMVVRKTLPFACHDVGNHAESRICTKAEVSVSARW
jgi:hypothetical protein